MDRAGRFAKAVRPGRRKRAVAYGIYLGPESVDANLSRVRIPAGEIDGSDMELRFVPKGKHVTDITPSSTVLMMGSPLCIIAEVVGDISLAEI